MKINSPNHAKIIVELSPEDMSELDITYENMDYSNIETRRVIWTVLDKVRKTLGRDIDPSGQLTIETVPLNDGGCVIFFTVNDTSRDAKAIIPQKVRVYEFENIDNVIDLFSSIGENTLLGDLYTDGKGKFRLITSCDDPFPIKIKFSEYSHLCLGGKLAAEMTREHWDLKAADFGIFAKR